MTDSTREIAQLLVAVRALRDENDRLRARAHEPIAIVGLSARLPFEAKGRSIWDGLVDGVDCSSDIPSDRWDVDMFHDAKPGSSDKAVTRRGSFLADVRKFDAPFFGIAPVEAHAMDPQQRLLLETSWEAAADAGLPLDRLRAGSAGVFVGLCGYDFGNIHTAPEPIMPYLATGSSPSVLSGRLSYVLGLNGPSLTVDTACSSSLVALHLACDSLRQGTSDHAFAIGVNLLVSPYSYVKLSKLGALSVDGRSRSFDAGGTGYGRGEGCSVVVLKRLGDARRDGDRIRALIRGSAVNQDGRSDGLTAPSAPAQRDVIRAALRSAGVKPGEVQYIEAHGTGTVLGDPIEVDALSEVFGEGEREAPLAIGSIKSNIGHLEGASGVSGVVKTVLSMEHRELPASLHFRTPNPHIAWEEIPIRVQSEHGGWPTPGKPLVAGVSSFGFSGTNAHVVMSEAPAEEVLPVLSGRGEVALCISAKTEGALKAYAERYGSYLARGDFGGGSWRDVAYTSSVRQTHLEERLVVTGRSAEEWREKLSAYVRGERAAGLVTGRAEETRRQSVFVYSGQGTQWWGMGRALLAEEGAFRRGVERCAEEMSKHAGWSLLEELGRGESTTRLERTDIAQGALVALQVGLTEQLRAWGVEAEAVVGHSVGEISAAWASGKLSLEEACRLAVIRGRVMHEASGSGKMAAARLGFEEAEELVLRWAGRVEVGAYNGRSSVTLSGEASAVEEVVAELTGRGVDVRELRVSYAFHSRQMEGAQRALRSALGRVETREAEKPIVSTLTGSEGRYDAEYWAEQLRAPVKFAHAVETLLDREYAAFLEVGPHPALLSAIDESASEAGRRVVLVPTLRRNEDAVTSMLASAGGLHVAGCAVDWSLVLGERGRVVSVPSYPWQRQEYWIPTKAGRPRDELGQAMLQRHMASSEQAGKHVFELELDVADDQYAYLVDHKIRGEVWLPGAAYVELALEAARVVEAGSAAEVEDLILAQPVVLSDEEPVTLQVTLQPAHDGWRAFRVAARRTKDPTAEWVEHASGKLRRSTAASPPEVDLLELRKRCSRPHTIDDVYDRYRQSGLEYGPAFRGIEELWSSGDGEALGKLLVPSDLEGYVVHPTLLDAAFQCVGVIATGYEDRTFVPSSVRRVIAPTALGKSAVWVHARLLRASADAVEFAVRLLDDAGKSMLDVGTLRAVPLGGVADPLDGFAYELQWRVAEPKKHAEGATGRWLVLRGEDALAEQLAGWLRSGGGEVVVTSADDERMLASCFGGKAPRGIVDTRPLANGEAALGDALRLVQALTKRGFDEAPRLTFVTRSCQAASASEDVEAPEQALLWGFVGTVMMEMPELSATIIDIEARTPSDALGRALVDADDETRIALRAGARKVPRLTQYVRPSALPGADRDLVVSPDEGYELEVLEPGRLGSLGLRPAPVPHPPPGSVVIRTRASGVNFRDTLMALGMYPGLASGRLPMGGECAGIVHSVGEGVTTVRVGDAVMATGDNAFDAYFVTRANQVVRKPASLSYEQAAAMPAVVTTVLYALENQARLKRGERILVHAATGGVGIAAIQYAQLVGAEIFATAGNEAKRQYLRDLGLVHVYDSRTLDWAEQIREATGGRGVDVVLNSLAGEAIGAGIRLLAPYGRFVELGKRDIYANASLGLFAFRNNITLSVVALDQIEDEKPAEAHALLDRMVELVESGGLRPLPVETFSVTRAVDAFELLSRAKHIGKVVLTAEESVVVRDPNRSELVDPQRTQLVTGGLGGLGLVVAESLRRLGAKHIALVGRGAPSEEATAAIARLEAGGATVHVLRGDVSDPKSLRAALAELAGPPVGGVVHAAGLVDDATLENQTNEKMGRVLAPKVGGAKALAACLPDLTYEVYFSSAAGVLGSPGQAPYAAANAFLDALAHQRSALGRRTMSLDWGAWAEVGLAARSERVENVSRQGMTMISPDQGGELFVRLLGSPAAQLIPMAMNVRQLRSSNPALARSPLFRELSGTTAGARRHDSNMIQKLREASSDVERLGMIEDALIAGLAGILHAAPDDISRTTSFKQLGFDSLMTVGFKNALERELPIPISTATLFAHPTVKRLAIYLREKLLPPAVAEPAEPMVTAAPSVGSEAELDASVDAELEELRKRGFLS